MSLNPKEFKVYDTDFRERVIADFKRQKVMSTIGASLLRVDAGEVEILLPFSESLTQQNGFLHAGIVTAIVDSACGYAAYSLMPKNASVLSIEFKINLCSPSIGEKFIAVGKVRKAGKTVTVTEGEVWAFQSGEKKLTALMQGTMMTVFSLNERKVQ